MYFRRVRGVPNLGNAELWVGATKDLGFNSGIILTGENGTGSTSKYTERFCEANVSVLGS